MKYEYMVRETHLSEDYLNDLGILGWELISVVLKSSASASGSDKVFYFKRVIK